MTLSSGLTGVLLHNICFVFLVLCFSLTIISYDEKLCSNEFPSFKQLQVGSVPFHIFLLRLKYSTLNIPLRDAPLYYRIKN